MDQFTHYRRHGIHEFALSSAGSDRYAVTWARYGTPAARAGHVTDYAGACGMILDSMAKGAADFEAWVDAMITLYRDNPEMQP